MTELACNPRYVCYAREVHGAPPLVALNLDRALWPGGCMCGFMLWIQARWREFGGVRLEMNPKVKTDADHEAFDAWLKERVGL